MEMEQKNPTESFKWSLRAAFKGYTTAQYSLALSFETGVEKNLSEALKWYLQVADQNHVKSQYNLAIKYRDGSGIEQSSSNSLIWCKSAAKNGHAKA
jgi:uncharacterized protein